MDLAHELYRLVENTGPWALPALGLASLIESVFPPFPGDSIVLFGALYAVRGVLPLPAVFLTVTLGGVLGNAIGFFLGGRLGAAAVQKARHNERLLRFEEAYRRRGDLLILFNRFLPGIRGFFFLAAGMSGMRFGRTMLLGAASSAVWNALLLAGGFAMGSRLGRMEALVRTYSTVVWVLLLLVAGFFVIRLLLARPRPPS